MAKNDSTGLAFGIGLVLGGFMGYFLATDKGRELTNEAGQQIRKVGDEVREKAREEIEHLSGKLDQVLDQSKGVAEQLEENLKKSTRKTAEKVDTAVEKSVGNFKKGVEKARKNLNAEKDS